MSRQPHARSLESIRDRYILYALLTAGIGGGLIGLMLGSSL